MNWLQWMVENRVQLVPVLESKGRKGATIKKWTSGRREIYGPSQIVPNRLHSEGTTPEAALQALKTKLDNEDPSLDPHYVKPQKMGGEFTSEQWKKHKKEHPKADVRDHTIIKDDAAAPGDEGHLQKTLAQSDVKKRVAEDVAADIHEAWRAGRKRADGTFEPRMKDDGKGDQVDIANTKYSDLPEKWKKENAASGHGAVEAVHQAVKDGHDLSDPKTLETISSTIHEQWLDRNKSWAPKEQQGAYSDLSDEEKEKDRVVARFAIHHTKKLVGSDRTGAQSMRALIIRLAQERPELRVHLVPLLRLSRSESLAEYKGRTYRVLYWGQTKFGERVHLQFMDKSKDFWVAASLVTTPKSPPPASCSVPKRRDPNRKYECEECGDYVYPGTKCWETGCIH